MPAKYEQLRAWQIAHEIALKLYRETESWPKREWYGLAAHLRKTATSIPSNLAEGSAKRGKAAGVNDRLDDRLDAGGRATLQGFGGWQRAS